MKFRHILLPVSLTLVAACGPAFAAGSADPLVRNDKQDAPSGDARNEHSACTAAAVPPEAQDFHDCLEARPSYIHSAYKETVELWPTDTESLDESMYAPAVITTSCDYAFRIEMNPASVTPGDASNSERAAIAGDAHCVSTCTGVEDGEAAVCDRTSIEASRDQSLAIVDIQHLLRASRQQLIAVDADQPIAWLPDLSESNRARQRPKSSTREVAASAQ